MQNTSLEISALPVAAFLQAKGFKLLKIVQSNSPRAIFSFEFTNEILDAKNEYFIGGNVDAQRFWNCIKNLKEAIYAGKQ